jgi:hypothetical protein
MAVRVSDFRGGFVGVIWPSPLICRRRWTYGRGGSSGAASVAPRRHGRQSKELTGLNTALPGIKRPNVIGFAQFGHAGARRSIPRYRAVIVSKLFKTAQLSMQCTRAHGGWMQARLKQLKRRRSALLARSVYFTTLAVGQLDSRQGVECLRLAADARDMELILGIISERFTVKPQY